MKLRKLQAPDMESFRALLRKYDLKATPQRLAVHSAMLAMGHASADNVTEFISKKGEVAVTVASVYNNLSLLADYGIYDRLMSSNSKMYFDVNTYPHLHLYDTVSHEFTDIFDDALVNLLNDHFKKKRFKGYTLDRVDVQLVCRPSRKSAARKVQR